MGKPYIIKRYAPMHPVLSTDIGHEISEIAPVVVLFGGVLRELAERIVVPVPSIHYQSVVEAVSSVVNRSAVCNRRTCHRVHIWGGPSLEDLGVG